MEYLKTDNLQEALDEVKGHMLLRIAESIWEYSREEDFSSFAIPIIAAVLDDVSDKGNLINGYDVEGKLTEYSKEMYEEFKKLE